MNDKSAAKRIMFEGTEGNKDYLVIARSNGYILGIKPLVVISMDGGQYGFRLRMQKASTDQDISNTAADAEGMTEVFTDIPWSKRSTTRFSTVILTEVPWGIEYADKFRTTVLEGFGALLEAVQEKLGEVSLVNPDDAKDFLTEGYNALVDQFQASYAKFLASKEGSNAGNEAGNGMADVTPLFPQGDDKD